MGVVIASLGLMNGMVTRLRVAAKDPELEGDAGQQGQDHAGGDDMHSGLHGGTAHKADGGQQAAQIADSGAAPTADERGATDRLLASLRRGAPKGGFGIVVKLSHAGRAIEEVLAVTSPEPLTAENEARLLAELTRLHRDALPEALKVAECAVSVSAAREEIRRSLDGWLADLLPLLARSAGPPGVTARSPQAWSGAWLAPAAVAVTIGAIALGATLHWVVGWQTPPVIARDGPDACRPNGAEDAAAFTEAWRALNDEIGRELPRDDPFAAVQLDPAMRLQALVPTDAPDTVVCQKRRALAAIHQDLVDLKDVAQGTGLDQARSLDQYHRGELLNALEAFANLPLPDRERLCQAQEAVCLPVFMDADAAVMQAIVDAYRILLPNLHAAVGPTWLSSAGGIEELERALGASGLRRDEIILRGELHRAGLGNLATALLDPLHVLMDCPRQNTCASQALRRLWAQP